MTERRWFCGAFQPARHQVRGQSAPYRCTRKWGHLGDHEAENDEGETMAEWPRHVDRHVHLPEDVA